MALDSNGMKRFESEGDLHAFDESLNLKIRKPESVSTTSVVLQKGQEKLMDARIKRQGQGIIKAQINMPTKSIDVTGRYDQQEKSLTVYPERSRRDQKYAASIKKEASKQWQVAVEYPVESRQKKIVGSFMSEDQSRHGHVMVDLFSSADKALHIIVNGTRLDRTQMHYEASVQTQVSFYFYIY